MGGLEPQRRHAQVPLATCLGDLLSPHRNSSSAVHVCYQEGLGALLASQSGGPLGSPCPPRPGEGGWSHGTCGLSRGAQKPLEEAAQPHALQGGKQALPGSRFHGHFGDLRSPGLS